MNITDNAIRRATDDQLQRIHDALTALHIVTDDERTADVFTALVTEKAEVIDRIREVVDSEMDWRAERAMQSSVAHTIEHGEAAEADGKPMPPNKMLTYRAATLLRLLRLNAPKPCLDIAWMQVCKTEPE